MPQTFPSLLSWLVSITARLNTEVVISSTGSQTLPVCLLQSNYSKRKVPRRTPVTGSGVCGGVASPCCLPSDI